jgi:DNA polymerase-4
MDAFYASVEQNDNPDLVGKPVVVGSPSDRGVIAASSYEAREYGVRSAMPSSVAKRLCPNLIFISARMKRYSEVSSGIFEIFHRYSSKVEALSVDEAFLEIADSPMDLQETRKLALTIKKEIKLTTGLTASAGVSYNKFLAKLASDMEKPDGLVVIDRTEAERILPELPVEKFYGIGKISAEKMHLYGIHFGKDLSGVGLDFLVRNFGKAGEFYYNIARGVDNRIVEPGRERKSVGAEYTFEKDLVTPFQIIAELYKVERELWHRVEKHGKLGRTVTLKVKFDDFKQVTRSITSERPVVDFGSLHTIVTALRESTDFHRKKVRLLGVTISNLDQSRKIDEQLDLWHNI